MVRTKRKNSIETERKFLVSGDFRKEAVSSVRVRQGYLTIGSAITVRVRSAGDRGYLTIKGKSDNKGLTRSEWEFEIPSREAGELLRKCTGRIIDKTRYIVPIGKHIFEVDLFHRENKGLVIAEIELSSTNEKFLRPRWLGREVTGVKRYYNAMLSKRPYQNWKLPVKRSKLPL